MQANPGIFREYDIRGILGKDITGELAFHIGRALGTILSKAGKTHLIVGRDCRPSGVDLSHELMRGAQNSGLRVTDIGMVPTPLQYWAIQHLNADGGVEITGSHNPSDYNGFKISLQGTPFYGQDIQELYKLIVSEDYIEASGTLDEQNLVDAYIDELSNNLHTAKRQLKVVIDAGNGTGGITAQTLYEKLGHHVIPLYCEPDGNFPNHHPDPTVEENLIDLKTKVIAEKADLGVAFDGDADRIGVVDAQGEVIWGDKLMILLSRALLKEEPGATILGEVKCSKALYDDITAHGGRAIMWKTGHSLIKAKMKEEDAALAGEMSGHIFFKHRYYGFDDAVYAGGRLLEILSESDKTIAEMLSDVPKLLATPEIRRDCPDEIKFQLVDKIIQNFNAEEADPNIKVIDTDGLRLEWPDGWGLVRCSNTQPILVLRFEAQTKERLEAIEQFFEEKISSAETQLNS